MAKEAKMVRTVRVPSYGKMKDGQWVEESPRHLIRDAEGLESLSAADRKRLAERGVFEGAPVLGADAAADARAAEEPVPAAAKPAKRR